MKHDYDCLLECPECGAVAGQPCRTPSGRKSRSVHDLRPFKVPGDPQRVSLVKHEYPMAFFDMIGALMRHHTDKEIAELFAERAYLGVQYGNPDKWKSREAAWRDAANDMPRA